MSLVNLTPTAAETAVVLDPILYDSGWKRISGTGSSTLVETLKYDVDSVVRVFGRVYKSTQAQDWRLMYSTTDTANSAQIYKWLDLTQLHLSPIQTTNNFTDGVDYMIYNHNTNMTNTNTTNPYNVSGLSVAAGQSVSFKENGAQTSEGIEYRIIVERSTSAVMLGRALGKPQ